MKSYLIHFIQTTHDNDQSLYWRCDAQSENDAFEQLKKEIAKQGEQVIFCETIKIFI